MKEDREVFLSVPGGRMWREKYICPQFPKKIRGISVTPTPYREGECWEILPETSIFVRKGKSFCPLPAVFASRFVRPYPPDQ